MSHPLFQQLDREAIERFDRLGLPRPSNFPQLESGAIRDASGQPIVTGRGAPESVDAFIARTLGPNVPPFPAIVSREILPGEYFNSNGPESRDNYRNRTTTLEGEWVASPVFAVRGVFQQVDSHRLRREFNGLRPVAGQRLRSAISDYKPGGVLFSARIEAAWKHDLRAAGKHDVLAGFQHDGGKDVVSPITIATTRVVTFNPRTEPPPNALQLLRAQYGADYQEPGVVRKGGGHSNAFHAIVQSAFFSDRLRTLVGGRHIANHRPTDDDRDGREVDFTTQKWVPQVGVLLRLNRRLSWYGSYSRTFLPQRQQTADLAAIRETQGDPTSSTYRPPSVVPVQFLAVDLVGRGWETGMKAELQEGRLLGTVSYFTTEENARLDVDTANQLLYQLPGGTVRRAAGQSRARGVETEWIWTPRENYQALLSASWFFEKNEISNPSDVREVGSHLESVPRYTVNLWNKYGFAEGRLRGGYVGGGVSALGEAYVHPSWTVPVRSDAVLLVDAMVGFEKKLRGLTWDFRVNVRNLTDRRYLNGTFQPGEPRMVMLSVGLGF